MFPSLSSTCDRTSSALCGAPAVCVGVCVLSLRGNTLVAAGASLRDQHGGPGESGGETRSRARLRRLTVSSVFGSGTQDNRDACWTCCCGRRGTRRGDGTVHTPSSGRDRDRDRERVLTDPIRSCGVSGGVCARAGHTWICLVPFYAHFARKSSSPADAPLASICCLAVSPRMLCCCSGL